MILLAVVSAILALCIGAPFNSELDEEWNMYKLTYKKNYGDEEAIRRNIWEENIRYIQNHNLQADRGVHTFTVGMNQFGDMTVKEFAKVMNGYRMSNTTHKRATFLPPSNTRLPETVDWRTEGYVTGIKDQGQCGSCYAFSATGSMEGQQFKKGGKLISLSEQNLVDCSRYLGNAGCGGGLMDLCFEYVELNYGIDTETSYPYQSGEGKDDFHCRYNAANKASTVNDWADVKYRSEPDLQSAVATVGPISVAIDANHKSFQLYRSGVYYEPQCSSLVLDHGVLAVGYGTQNGSDYWLVKNSWAESWGNQGYIQMSRNRDNNCGIATQASYPII